MTKEAADVFVKDLWEITRVIDPSLYGIVDEDYEALKLALTSGNRTLVFAMAAYIGNICGLVNARQIAQKISDKAFNM